jgi:N-methylhydantoinase A
MIVPPEAGVASALGMLSAPPRVDRVASLGRRLDACSPAEIETAFGTLEDEAHAVLAGGDWAGVALSSTRLVDARCVGQGAHMPVTLPPLPWPEDEAARRAMITAAFREAYVARYSRPPPPVPIELVHVRVVLRAAAGAAALPGMAAGEAAGVPARRRIVIGQATYEASVHRRQDLPVGFRGQGPALVEEAGSTLVIGPGATFEVLDSGNIVVDLV